MYTVRTNSLNMYKISNERLLLFHFFIKMNSFSPQERAAASKIAKWWKRQCLNSVYKQARDEFEAIAKEIGDLPPLWDKNNIRALPKFTMSDECEMSFAMSALSARKASLKYDQYVNYAIKPRKSKK